ncbi:thioesterase family protein [Xylariomycetidae sp. FL2044]|nr:thioesterase family protein [Xylariomycetidae sp. FL2044]
MMSSTITFSEATRIERVGSHAYKVNLSDSFCVGAVPNGGYAGCCMLAAAREQLSRHGQPDTLTAHFEYPNRAAPGPALVLIEDVKLSPHQLSTLHLTLWQGKLLEVAPWVDRTASRRIVLAYTTHTNLASFTGITMPTGWEGTPDAALPEPLPDFDALKSQGGDGAWEEAHLPKVSADAMRSLKNWHLYLPRAGPLAPGVMDVWMRLASGERITSGALPYVTDTFPHEMHTYLAAPELRELILQQQQQQQQQAASTSAEGDGSPQAQDQKKGGDAPHAVLWFPTVVLNLEVKAPLPEEGAEWLAVRVTSKLIKDGRFDLEVVVRDVEGEVVALSHHVALILTIERNTGKKRSSPKAAL